MIYSCVSLIFVSIHASFRVMLIQNLDIMQTHIDNGKLDSFLSLESNETDCRVVVLLEVGLTLPLIVMVWSKALRDH